MAAVKVGINGFGRIGRNFFRAVRVLQRAGESDIEIVAVFGGNSPCGAFLQSWLWSRGLVESSGCFRSRRR